MAMSTLKRALIELLGDPPTYLGYPVDLSNLDQPVKGYVIPDMQKVYRDATTATRTYKFKMEQ